MSVSAYDQIQFLNDLQRLLSEGKFTSTYKYALLLSLADLSVEYGEDSDKELSLSLDRIAAKFIEYYWRQAIPYPGEEAVILRQNISGQAAVISRVKEARSSYHRLPQLQKDPERWKELKSRVRYTVSRYPVRFLQNVGRGELDFLYERDSQSSIRLRSGVAFCFRHFYPLIRELIEGSWIRYIRRQNHESLGLTTDLRNFLFGSERESRG